MEIMKALTDYLHAMKLFHGFMNPHLVNFVKSLSSIKGFQHIYWRIKYD